MRKRTVGAGLACASLIAVGAGWTARAMDHQAQEREVLAAVEGLYAVISGGAGEARDWDAFRGMFLDDRASMTFRRGQRGEDGAVTWSFGSMTPDEYVERAGPMFERQPFFETGVANEVEMYGTLAHVWSTYDAHHTEDGAGEPFMQGINSIQLVKTDGGWKVLSLAWVDTRSAGEIPERYRGGE
ncbi:MAG: nuclear transport factor 2 family protein [Phycisphaerales bacterium]